MLGALALLAIVGTQSLDSKIKSVLPTAEEDKWMQIPWRLNLMQARQDAVRSGKPMFLWIMNGHPMGCT